MQLNIIYNQSNLLSTIEKIIYSLFTLSSTVPFIIEFQKKNAVHSPATTIYCYRIFQEQSGHERSQTFIHTKVWNSSTEKGEYDGNGNEMERSWHGAEQN